MINTIKTTWKNSALGKLIVLFLAFLVLSPLGCCMCAIPIGLLSSTPTPTAIIEQDQIQRNDTLPPTTISSRISTSTVDATRSPTSTPSPLPNVESPETASSTPLPLTPSPSPSATHSSASPTETPQATLSSSPAPPPAAPTTNPTPRPTRTSTPTITFTSTPTSTPTATPAPLAKQNANLRSGPGTNYPRVGSVSAGENLKIVGRTEDGSWYKLANGAWIAAFLVKGLQSNPPIVQDIPTPPPTPTPKPPKPTGKPDVRIVGMLRDGVKGRNEPDEYVEIANLGNAPQDMTGWMLVSERRGNDRGQIFYFPRGFILQPGQHCRIYTNEYHPEYCGLSFNHRGAVWNNSKPDAALLVDNHGNVVSVWP